MAPVREKIRHMMIVISLVWFFIGMVIGYVLFQHTEKTSFSYQTPEVNVYIKGTDGQFIADIQDRQGNTVALLHTKKFTEALDQSMQMMTQLLAEGKSK